MVTFGMNAQVFITELADPDNETGARFVELYNAGSTAVDLSTGWQIGRYTNGNTTPSTPVDLTGTIPAGGFYIICNNAATFNATYGFDADQDIGTAGPADSNGDDQIYLMSPGSVVVDFFGVAGEDGSNTCHEFENGRAERIASVTSGNSTWDESEWNVWSDGSSASGCTNHISNAPRTAPDDFDPGSWIGQPVVSGDATSYVDATGVTQPTGADIPSTNWGNPTPVDVHVFQFNIADAGSGDGLPTKVKEITIKAGPNNTANWMEDIGGGYLEKESTGLSLTIDTPPTVTENSVTFYIIPDDLNISDGESELINLYVWPDSTTTDNSVIECMIDADNHGFVADVAGSTFTPTFTTDVVGNQFPITVNATNMPFVTQPSNIPVNQTMPAIEVGAADVNGNVDVDYSSNITVVFSGIGNMNGTFTQTTVNGVATFDDLSFDTEQTNVYLRSYNGMLNIESSDHFDVTAPLSYVLMISEVADPTDYQGRFVEIYNPSGSAVDFSNDTWYLAKQSNGGSWSDVQLTGSIPAGGTYVVGTSNFNSIYGFDPDLVSGVPNGNGDDGYFLYADGDQATGTLVDVYGVIDQDGSGQLWEYTDAMAVRNANIVIPRTDWTASEWTITGGDHTEATPGVHPNTSNPAITNIAISPVAPTSSDPVTVSATITDDGSIAAAFVSWGLSTGVHDQGTYTMTVSSGDTYTALSNIPAQANGTTVYYVVLATDNDANTTTSDEQSYTVTDTETLDWYNLQWPENGVIDEGGVFDVYAQAYEAGVTDAAGQGAGIDVWIGVNTEDTNPNTWTTWIPATYNTDQGNNDEYTAEIGSALSAGTYYYASRFQLNGSTYTYGGYNGGAWDVVNNVSGVLTVNAVPQTTTLPYTEDFATDLGQNYIYNVLGATKEWYHTGYSASMNGYNSGETEEDWLILPGINFDDYSNEVMTFDSWYNYGNDDANNYLKLVYSTDYAGIGDPSSATWTEIPYTQPASSNTWSGTGDIDLSGITGSMVYIAFKYHYEPGSYRSWSVDNFSIIEDVPSTIPEITNVMYSPTMPNSSETVTVSADITDDGTISMAQLSWGTVSGTYTQTIPMTSVAGNTYTTTTDIPAMANGTTVYFQIYAEDNDTYSTTTTEYSYTVFDMPSQTLFFSEYIEGSGQNKALEIYNGTGETVDLANYRVAYANNGNDWSAWHTFTVTTSLNDGDVIVIAADGCDAAIAAVADEILSYPDVVFYNGDDAVALEMTSDGGNTWNIVDIIGDPNNDPGSGWDVAGTTNGTSNHTLVRKYPDVTSGNTDWTASAGTNVDDSEWLVFDEDDFSYIGWHGEMPTNPTLVIVAPVDGSTVYSSTVPVDLNVQNFYVATPSNGDGYIVVDLNGMSFDVYTTTFNFADVPVGTYTMTATLVDNAGTPIVPTVSDVVTFYVDQTTLVSIHDIQYTTDAGDGTYPSTYAGMTVQTSGIVTAVDADGQYFIQDGDGGWNGIYVYDYGNTVNLGDGVLITATVSEYNGLTELSNVSDLQITSSGNTLPNVQVLSTLEANDEQYEGVLIRVTAECTNADAGFGMWTVNDGSGDLLVDDDLFAYTATATYNYEVTGVGHYSYGAFKILPRDIDDISVIVGLTENATQVTVYPNPAVNVVNISGDVQNVELFSALGQKMNAQYSNNTINVEGLTAGVYVLRITLNDGNVVTKQIIKK